MPTSCASPRPRENCVCPSAHLTVQLPTSAPAITPSDPVEQLLFAVEIDATDASGNAIHDLSAPLTISIRFTPLLGQNALLAQIYTIDKNGNSQALPTLVTANGDGSYTAVAQTRHLSPFEIFAPDVGRRCRSCSYRLRQMG